MLGGTKRFNGLSVTLRSVNGGLNKSADLDNRGQVTISEVPQGTYVLSLWKKES